jgi:hypothetical protein
VHRSSLSPAALPLLLVPVACGDDGPSREDGEQLQDDDVATLDDQLAKLDDVDADFQSYGFQGCGRDD